MKQAYTLQNNEALQCSPPPPSASIRSQPIFLDSKLLFKLDENFGLYVHLAGRNTVSAARRVLLLGRLLLCWRSLLRVPKLLQRRLRRRGRLLLLCGSGLLLDFLLFLRAAVTFFASSSEFEEEDILPTLPEEDVVSWTEEPESSS